MAYLDDVVQKLETQKAECSEAKRALIETQKKYYDRTSPIEEQVTALTSQIDAILAEMDTDPAIADAQAALDSALCGVAALKEEAEGTCLVLWQTGALSSKTFAIEGCQFKVRETRKRTVTNHAMMAAAATKDGVYDQVIKGAKYTLNRKQWNAWVDLHSPVGVEVETVVSAVITFKEGTNG